jgi:hypothetical protein
MAHEDGTFAHGALRLLREMVTGVPNFSSDHHELFKGCALGKYTETAFPSSDSRAAGILDLIHSYVCGPMSLTSLTDFLYYVVFIDDFSRKSWIFFIKTKGQVLCCWVCVIFFACVCVGASNSTTASGNPL